jgi:hypothetical protein
VKTTFVVMIGLGSKCELGLIGVLGDLLLRGSIMTQQTEKTLHNAFLILGAFFLTMFVVMGIASLRTGAWIDLTPKQWISDEDKQALKNPEDANKAAYEKMSREVWQNAPAVQPQAGWDQGWKT